MIQPVRLITPEQKCELLSSPAHLPKPPYDDLYGKHRPASPDPRKSGKQKSVTAVRSSCGQMEKWAWSKLAKFTSSTSHRRLSCEHTRQRDDRNRVTCRVLWTARHAGVVSGTRQRAPRQDRVVSLGVPVGHLPVK